ncbi:MAG: zinc ABC transporter substrate-binding protein, partial [Clostridia bacterium]|nr:zinc ABC transporter substrate-binding protein [Clostridia bacterium]
MKRIFALLITAALLCPIFTACGQTPDDGRLSIVTTTFPPYDFARAVVGDAASVTMLIDPGIETHSYDPSPRDIEKIRRADIFIYGGGESDAWIDGVLDSI